MPTVNPTAEEALNYTLQWTGLISASSAEKAKSVLMALCTNDPALQSRAKKLLDAMDSLESGPNAGECNNKRKAESAIKICTKCQEPFYEEENSGKACRYHSGSSTHELWK